MQQYIGAINTYLSKIDFPTAPTDLYDPIRYILDIGGKRLRPAFCLLAYESSKPDWQSIIPAACSIEVFHNFTLMHDDIMDNAPLRRGKTTIHEKWNPNVAILSGDAMLIEAYKLLTKVESQYLRGAVELFNDNAILVCEGQQYDMDYETQEQVSVDEYLSMIKLKTAVLLAASLKLGSMLAGESEERQSLFYQLGLDIGLGFQLMDDFLDVFGDQATFGKQVGGDIISNKKTFLLIKALEKAKGESLTALNHWLEIADFDPSEKVAAVTAIYRDLGVDEIAQDKISEFYERAEAVLQRLSLNGTAHDTILGFMQQLRTRST